MAVANVCYHMRIPVANEKTWLHLLPKYHKFRALQVVLVSTHSADRRRKQDEADDEDRSGRSVGKRKIKI